MTNARVFDINGPDLVTVQDWDNMVPTVLLDGTRMSKIRLFKYYYKWNIYISLIVIHIN